MLTQFIETTDIYDCELVNIGTQPRCYQKNSPNIERICHQCGRPMSAEAEIYTAPTNWKRVFLKDSEFTGLNLQDISSAESAVHCDECLHYHYSWQWFISIWNFSGTDKK